MARSKLGSGAPRTEVPQTSSTRQPRTRMRLRTLLGLAFTGVIIFVIWYWFQVRNEGEFAGTWMVDEETRAWLARTCVDLAFDADSTPTLDIEIMNGDVILQFNDVKRTRIMGRHLSGRVIARQLVPTSQTGRFCGHQTTIDLSWRIVRAEQDELVGRWVTPGCEVCPDRRFRALRSSETNR